MTILEDEDAAVTAHRGEVTEWLEEHDLALRCLIQECMDALEISAVEFGRRCRMNRGTVSGILAGRRGASRRDLAYFGVALDLSPAGIHAEASSALARDRGACPLCGEAHGAAGCAVEPPTELSS